MKIIPLNIKITRDTNTGKKLYNNNLRPTVPELSDSNTSKIKDISIKEAANEMRNLRSYAIIPGTELVIVDIDSEEAMGDVVDIVGPPEDKYTYIVTTDKGLAHYVFTPSGYFNKSPLKHTSRKKSGDIDILQGKCFTWGYGSDNETKRTPEDLTIEDANPIPDDLVDYLVKGLIKTNEIQKGDSNYNQLYIGRDLTKAIEQTKEYLQNYKNPNLTRAWGFFDNTKEHIIPNRYKEDMDDDLNPDSIPHNIDSAEFIQSTVAKLLRDNSISKDNIIDLMELITTVFWSKPITREHMLSKMMNLTTQNFNGVHYNYDPQLLRHPMVSINKGGFGKIYVDIQGDYHVETLTSLVNLGRFQRFRLSVQAKVNRVNNKIITSKNEEPLLKTLDLITKIDDITKPRGLLPTQGEIKLYNTYNKTVYHNIVLGIEPEPAATREDFPTFIALMENLTADHREYPGEQEKMIDNFLFFLSQKMSKFIYSPLIFQLNGIGGIGKGVFVDTLATLTGGKFKFDLAKSNKHFNELSMNKMWGQQSEIPVTEENKEELKNISGNREKTIEAKGISAIVVPNIRTDFVETNNDKVFRDPRRFVLWQGFLAKPWNYAATQPRLMLELRRLCAYLRDIDPSKYDRRILTNSNMWNGKLIEDTEVDREDSFGYGEDVKLARLIGRYKNLTGEELDRQLTEILGKGYWNIVSKYKPELWIILYGNGLVDEEGNAPTHNITPSMMKRLGIPVKRQTTGHNYNKSVKEIIINLTKEQYEYFSFNKTLNLNMI